MKQKKYLVFLIFSILVLLNITVFAEYDTIDLSTINSGYTDYNVVYNGYTYERKITYTNINIPIGKTVTIEFEDFDEYNYYDGTINYIDTTYFNIVSDSYKKLITITPIKAGTTHIDCEYNKYSGSGNVYAKCIARANITIIDDLEITLTSTSKTMNVNKTKYLQASITPYELYIDNIITYGVLKWTSSNSDCVSISCGNKEVLKSGKAETIYTYLTDGAITLTSKNVGTSIITCELSLDSSVKATCVVTVLDNRIAVSDVTLNLNSISLTTSESETLVATIKPINATNQNVTWESSDTDVVIVSNGKLYPQTEGTATVTVTTDDGGYKSTCKVNISNPWDIIIKPTESEAGIAEKNIGLGKKINKVLPVLTDSTFWKITEQVNATCKTEGYIQYSSECGAIKVNLPPNNNHSWNKRSETDLGNGEVSSYYVCTCCNKAKTETEPAFLYALKSDKTIQIYGFKYGTNLRGEICFPSKINGYSVKTVNLDLSSAGFDLSNVTGVVFEDGITEVGDGFSALENLAYVKLPNTLETINAGAFKNCSKITSIEIPGTVLSIGEEAFSGCTALEKVVINEGVEEIGAGAFLKCPIKYLDLPTTIKILEDYCFLSAKITEISLPEGLTVLGKVFSNIEYYYIPSTVTSIKNLYSFGDGVCKGIYVSGNNLNYSSDEYGVLYNKDKTELLVYPAAAEEKIYSVPDNVENIGVVAFGNTERQNLETLSLPATLKTISGSALWMCTNVRKIIFRGTKEAFSDIKIESNNNILETAEIVYETDITDISLDNTSLTMYVDESNLLNVTVTPNYVTNIKWSSSDENIVSVSNGIITAVNVGIATITVSNNDGNVFATCIVTVKEEQSESVYAPQASILDTYVKKGTKLSLESLTEDALIYYTTDESTPTIESNMYTEPITINENTTIRAIAIKEGLKNSDITTFVYTIIEDEKATISISDKKGKAGDTITLTLGVSNNPGIAGMILKLSYDEELTLANITTADALSNLTFTPPANLSKNPCTLLWDGITADNTNGTFLTLTFKINDNASDGEYNVNVSYTTGDIYDDNTEDIDVQIDNGVITVYSYKIGDVNEDDVINAKDITILRKYISGDYGVTANEDAADVNKDGILNAKDITILRKYISGDYGIVLD